jgi:hypothetical protein
MRDVISQNGASNSWNAERVMAFQPEGKPIKAKRKSPKAKKGPNLRLSCGAAKAKDYWVTRRSICSRLKESRRFKNSPVPLATQLRGSSAWITVKPVASLIT